MSDSEYEEDEFLVFADFKNQFLPHEIGDPKAAIKIIGIETKNPIAEINGNIFKGTYDYALGTDVFFEREDDDDSAAAPPDQALFEPSCKQKYKYFDKTNKVINFQRVYVEKNIVEADTTNDPQQDKEGKAEEEEAASQSLKLNVTYEEAIKQLPGVSEAQWLEKNTLNPISKMQN